MPIHLEFTPTFQDYLCAQQLHAKRNAWGRFNNFGWRWISPALGILVLGLAALIAGPGVTGTGSFVYMICAGVFLVLYPFYVRYRLKSCYKRTRVGDGSRTFDIDHDSIKAREGQTSSEILWSAIQNIREDENLMMLYIAPAKFVMIPKRCCTAQELSEIMALFDDQKK